MNTGWPETQLGKRRTQLAKALGYTFREGRISDAYFCKSAPSSGYPDQYHGRWFLDPQKKFWTCGLCCDHDLPDPWCQYDSQKALVDDYYVLKHVQKIGEGRRYDMFMACISNLTFVRHYVPGDYATTFLHCWGWI